MTDEKRFAIEMGVRDYECDLQGIVNNAVYQNYLEHARHVYLKSIGVDFAEYTKRGVYLVVVRAELDYKLSLRSGDHFAVTAELVRESRLRFAFLQTIVRLPDQKVSMVAKIVGTVLNERGRPEFPPEFDELVPYRR